MPLVSQLFAGDAKLNAALTTDSAHLVVGTQGDHVSKVQTALFLVDELHIAPAELNAKLYGPSTAAAVLAYKKKRRIINRSYQSQEDNIVGKMTIERLDRDVQDEERRLADFPLVPHNLDFV